MLTHLVQGRGERREGSRQFPAHADPLTTLAREDKPRQTVPGHDRRQLLAQPRTQLLGVRAKDDSPVL
ncbi:hypothetical protein ABZ695_34675, partial [Streptomyces sp. NPDC006976]|uniref:hypothetical protein n=1 Tax=Streptomyces sp. NPDC006976 TaxID=3154311 RepID=UPI0033FF1F07